MSKKLSEYPWEKKPFYTPALEEISNVLNEGLRTNFEVINVSVVDCPDLTQPPFTLAKEGLGGNANLVEIGGPSYLLPLPDLNKLYDLKSLPELLNLNDSLIVGAGAGPFPYIGVNCEGIYNLSVSNGLVNQQSRISKIKQPEGIPLQETLPNSETRCALLANLYVCEGKPGKVLKVHVTKRIGQKDFISSIRETLLAYYKDNIVGLGGTFLVKNGKAYQHVMDNFSETPINTDEELNEWLYFFHMSAPLVAVGTMATGEYDLDLRVQHFHSFSDHNEAGHYHYDTTPDTIEYLGYFNVAKYIYRIDKPPVSHGFGKD